MGINVTSVLLLLSLLALASRAHNHHRGYYTAAVFEHARFGNESTPPHLIVDTNLQYYKKAADLAGSKGVDIIVFPEYGIFPPWNRSEIKSFIEYIPDPTTARINPCEQPHDYSERPILLALSCMAKNNSLFVVGNMGDLQECSGQTDCPSDGAFHFNANVVFNREGTLILKYHKERLFYEFGVDLARHQQNSTFQTDFGTFATYICFDIDFGRMSEVAQWPTVDGVAFSTMFVDQPPQMTSVQYWQSWALANKAVLLAANVQLPGNLAVGSGIFHGMRGALEYTFNPDGLSKLVVAKVTRKGSRFVPPEGSITAVNETKNWNIADDVKDVPEVCSYKVLGEASNKLKDYRCVSENFTEYTFVQLQGPSGHAEACNNGICCSVDYTTANGLTDRFFLGVFRGIYHHFSRYAWFEEDCVMARCDAFKNNTCSTYPTKTRTSFTHVHLKSNLTSRVVYPSVLESGIRLPPVTEWYHEKHGGKYGIHFHHETGKKLIIVGMKGRRYDLDPPYKR